MAAGEELRIDVSNYAAQKAAGSVRVFKVNGIPHYATKRYDQITGAPVAATTMMDRESVVGALANAQKTVAAISELLADIDAAPEV